MTTDEHTARLNALILRNAAQSCVLADAEKLGAESFVSYAALDGADPVLTDASLSTAVLREFSHAGARIEVVPSKEQT